MGHRLAISSTGMAGSLLRMAAWSIGLPVATWRHLTGSIPIYRSHRDIADVPDTFPRDDAVLPAGPGRLQRPADGVGPRYIRHYGIRITGSRLSAEELLDRLAQRPDDVSPSEISHFEKQHGAPGRLRIGDEYLIRIAGPWDGPVRVIDRQPASFRLATLAGHMEAGEIEFRATDAGRGRIELTITSWARSGDALFDLLYRLGISRELQLYMWARFLAASARTAGGRVEDGVRLHTQRAPAP